MDQLKSPESSKKIESSDGILGFLEGTFKEVVGLYNIFDIGGAATTMFGSSESTKS